MKSIEKFYIGKKQYIPDESDALCTIFQGDPFDILTDLERKVLYRTKKGAYFLVTTKENSTNVCILNEKGAFDFMDKNATGIDIQIYNKIFGEPERG